MVSCMKHKKPINILYIPAWLVESRGLATIESCNSLDDILEPICKFGEESEDFLKIQAANYAFSTWIYGGIQLAAKVQSDVSYLNTQVLGQVDTSSEQSNDLLRSVCGIHNVYENIEDKGERFRILCRSFEDVVVKSFSNGDIVVYVDHRSPEYFSRKRLLKKLVCHLIDFRGYKDAAKTELFKTCLSSSYKEEDMKYALYHRVG